MNMQCVSSQKRKLVYGVIVLVMSCGVFLQEANASPAGRPLVVIPNTSAIPTIDGVVSDGEWKDAAMITGFVSHIGKGLYETPSRTLLKYDERFLYVLNISKRLNDKPLKITKKHGGPLYLDDSCELHIRTSKGTIYQLIGNAGGYKLERRFGTKVWKCDAKYAVGVEDQRWVAEWAIPIHALDKGWSGAGDQWHFNVADNRTTHGKPVTSWVGRSEWVNPGSSWINWLSWGIMRFGESKSARIETLKFASATSLELSAQAVGDAGTVELLTIQRGQELARATKKLDGEQFQDLVLDIPSTGNVDIVIKMFDSKGSLLQRHVVGDQPVRGPLDLDVLTDPFRNSLLVKARGKGKKGETLKAVVRDWSGKFLVEASLQPAEAFRRGAVEDTAFMGYAASKNKGASSGQSGPKYRAEIPIDLFGVKKGIDVQVTWTAPGAVAAESETRRVTTFSKPKWFAQPEAAKRDTVPAPWHPVLLWEDGGWRDTAGRRYESQEKTSVANPESKSMDLSVARTEGKGRVVRAWGREYCMDSEPGVLMESIHSLGKPILAKPMRLLISQDKKEVPWESSSSQSRFDGIDLVNKSQWHHGEMKVKVTSRLEYDGFVWYELELSSDAPVKVDKIRVEVPIRREVAQLFNYRTMDPWPNNCKTGVVDKRGVTRIPFVGGIALTNDRTGFGWINSSMNGWRPYDPKNPMSLVVNSKTATLRAHIADRPVTIHKPWKIQFGVQVCPIKPWDTKVAHLRAYEPIGYNWLSNPKLLDDAAARGVEVLSFHEHWSRYQDGGYGFDDISLKALIREVHRRGMKIVLYAGFGHSDQNPTFDFYRWPWLGESLPSYAYIRHFGPKLERVYTTTKCPQAHWSDFMVAQIARWIDEYDADGVFVDGMFVLEASDRAHWGRSYDQSQPGQKRDWLPLDARRYAERVYRAVKSRKPDGIINMSKGAEFPLYSGGFATNSSTGETIAVNMKASNTFKVDYNSMRAIYGRQYGVPADLWGYNLVKQGVMTVPQVLGFAYLHGVPMRAAGGRGYADAVRPYWLRGEFFKHAEFVPYWDSNNPVMVENAKNVKASVYRYGNRIAITVVNMNKKRIDAYVRCKVGKRKWFDTSVRRWVAKDADVIEVSIPAGGSVLLLTDPPEIEK